VTFDSLALELSDRHQHLYAGLGVKSALALPELPLATGFGSPGGLAVRLSSDRVIPVGSAPHWRHDWSEPDGAVSLSGLRIGDRYGLDFPGVAEAWFTIDGNIDLWRDPDASAESVRHVLLDQVFPRLIAQRGTLVLHGSVATTAEGRTVVILGDSGMGKSTLASGIALSGGQVLTDDCLLIAFDGEQALAVPSYAGLRLWPDSLMALFEERQGEATPMTHYSSKLRLPSSTPASAGHAPTIDAILVLQGDDQTGQTRLSSLTPQQACMAVITNAFQLDLGKLRHTHALLGLSARLARSVPVLAFAYPRDYARLPSVVADIRATLDVTPIQGQELETPA